MPRLKGLEGLEEWGFGRLAEDGVVDLRRSTKNTRKGTRQIASCKEFPCLVKLV